LNGRGRNAAAPRPDEQLLRTLALLAGDVRLRLLQRLAEGPCAVSELAAHLNVSIALVSHNLRRLLEVGLVQVRPKARQRMYRLDGTLARSIGGRLAIDLPAVSGWRATLTGPPAEADAPPVATLSRLLDAAGPPAAERPQRHRSGPVD
jgi:DNA-binding transcriptional ArsR family regulator